MALLSVRDLQLSVPYHGERFLALRGLGFDLEAGGSLGIVGESGSGKSLTALAIAGLSSAQVRHERGSIRFDGQELTAVDERTMRELRGDDISMIFQDSSGALNPLMRVGDQAAEGLLLFDGFSADRAAERVRELFDEVELPPSSARKYPHQLSGGQRQRVMIAMALARQPRLLIADEPTTALDLTTQHQLLRLLKRLHEQRGMTLLLISHDISVVRRLTERLIVLYGGEMMEEGPTERILERPLHPYTRGLLGALPSFERRQSPLATLEGVSEALNRRPQRGCVFAHRCPLRRPDCTERVLSWQDEQGHLVRCNAVAEERTIP